MFNQRAFKHKILFENERRERNVPCKTKKYVSFKCWKQTDKQIAKWLCPQRQNTFQHLVIQIFAVWLQQTCCLLLVSPGVMTAKYRLQCHVKKKEHLKISFLFAIYIKHYCVKSRFTDKDGGRPTFGRRFHGWLQMM